VRIAFLMDDPAGIAAPALDSTLHIVRETRRRGHETLVLFPRNLTVRSNEVQAFVHRIGSPAGDDVAAFTAGLAYATGMEPVAALDVLFYRADPPPDPRTLSFLDLVRDDVLLVNGVDGLRRWSNKFYPLMFRGVVTSDGAPIIPETHISKNRKYLRRVLDESPHRYMVLKPLVGHGGRGVIVLDRQAPRNTDSLLDYYIGEDPQQNYVVLQEYLPAAEQGDVRVLVLDGEPIGAMRRIPAEGDYRANVHAGGRVAPYALSPRDREVVAALAPRLRADGLFFVGLDLIDGRLVEVNVVSPGGIPRINALDGVRLEERVVDFLERTTQLGA
jgi:glutathione synthase